MTFRAMFFSLPLFPISESCENDCGWLICSYESVAPSQYFTNLHHIQVHVPPSCMLDGVHSQHFFGTGVIIHHSKNMGLVVVDKNTVAVSACDVILSFAAFPMEIPGEVTRLF